MSRLIDEARSELEAAQSALEAALRAWDESVSELWRTSLALTPADVTHRDGSKPRSIDEILQKVEEQTGKGGRAAFENFLAKVRPTA